MQFLLEIDKTAPSAKWVEHNANGFVKSLTYRAGLRSRKESEIFGWSRILNNTGSRSRIFCPTPTPEVELDHISHHTPKLGIPVEMAQFLLKRLLKQRFIAGHHDIHWFLQPNFSPFMLRSRSRESQSRVAVENLVSRVRVGSRKFWKGRSQIFFLRLRNPDIKQIIVHVITLGVSPGLFWAQMIFSLQLWCTADVPASN